MDPTEGMAETLLGVTGADLELGELVRPIAARWMGEDSGLVEKCVGAIRESLLSNRLAPALAPCRPEPRPCWMCQNSRQYVPASDPSAAPVDCPICVPPPAEIPNGDPRIGTLDFVSMFTATYRGHVYRYAEHRQTWILERSGT